MSETSVRNILLSLLVCLTCRAVAGEGTRETPLVRAVKQSRDSVVNIHTEKMAADERESRFFASKTRKVTGMGTGIVIDERGYIVTNYHVIQDVDIITVTMHNGTTFEGQSVSYDRKHDLAIIRVNSKEPLTVMAMGTSSDLMLAETVFAVGNAFGYEDTVTEGIISALHRDVEVDETQSYENLIQTSASINPGNSGGPLFNLDGEVIGINVAIRSGAQRIGFAIPIDDARKTIARLLSVERLNGNPHGLETRDLKTAAEKNLIVERVQTGSAAEMCGIRAGDIIRKIRGIAVNDGTDLERSLLEMPRGKVLDVVLVRDGREQTLQFTVGVGKSAGIPRMTAALNEVVVTAPPATKEVPVTAVSRTTVSGEEQALDRVWQLLGLQLQDLNETERREVQKLSLPGGYRYKGGMRVTSVRPESAASTFVREGDVLLGLNGRETLNLTNVSLILSDVRPGQSASMKCQIHRSGAAPMEGTLQVLRHP